MQKSFLEFGLQLNCIELLQFSAPWQTGNSQILKNCSRSIWITQHFNNWKLLVPCIKCQGSWLWQCSNLVGNVHPHVAELVSFCGRLSCLVWSFCSQLLTLCTLLFICYSGLFCFSVLFCLHSWWACIYFIYSSMIRVCCKQLHIMASIDTYPVRASLERAASKGTV